METTIVNHTEFGLELKQATEITSGLTQILEERKVLAENYATTIQMEITKENLPIFKELRLKIRDNRTKGIESWHKTNKEFYLRGGQFVDAIKRKEIEENLRMESNLEENEKHFEKMEFDRIAALSDERRVILEPYSEFVPFGISFGQMNKEEFAKLFNGAKLQYDAKVAKEQQLEEERLEAEKQEQERAAEELRIEELHKSRKDIALPFFDFWSEFEKTLHFGTVSESDFNAFIDRIKNEKVENDQKFEAQRIENEKLKAESDKREKEIAKERAKFDADIEKRRLESIDFLLKNDFKNAHGGMEANTYNHFIGALHYSNLTNDNELELFKNSVLSTKENTRIQAELNAKREAEVKAEKEKAEAEKKSKLEAEKLAKAPVKQQMQNWVDSFELPCPSTDTDLSAEIITKFEAFKAWAKTQIENL